MFCIAPVIDQSAATPPTPMSAQAPLDCSVIRARLSSRRLCASPGMMVPTLSTSVCTALGSATMPKTPSATSRVAGIARNP